MADVVRLDGLRMWVEQADKQVKGSLGWSQYQVRRDGAMRRHWALVQGAFAFCWWAEGRFPTAAAPETDQEDAARASGERGEKTRVALVATGRPPRSWPVALRRVRAWLDPALFLWRCWWAWSDHPPPPPLQRLLDWLLAGQPLMLYDTS